jgi:LPS-assembly protein
VEAGRISYDASAGSYRFEDGVRLRRGVVVVRARTAGYDPRTGTLDAAGEVLLTAPGRVVAADGLHAVLDGPWEAREVAVYLKSRPLVLDGIADRQAAEREGRNRLSLHAGRLSGEPPPQGEPERFTADDVRLTLCDCQGGAPSWEIRASRAEVTPGRSAILSWPVVYVTPRFLFIDHPIPVLPLPWLYVPLASRQTGFLFPVVNIGSRTGWELREPFFLTLGPSWDATFTLGYAFGPSQDRVDTAEAEGRDPGVRGVGGAVELRWAPVEGVRGEVRLLYAHDTLPYAWKPASGDRVGLLLENEARLGPGSFLNARLALVGDAAYPQDFVTDLLLRSAEYYRSAVAAGWATEHLLLEADLSYHEQIGSLGQPGVPVVPFGAFGGSVPSFHRLPAATATLLPIAIAGPLQASGQAGVARFAPIEGITDRSVGGIGPGERFWDGPLPLPPGGSWVPGQRLAATRAWSRLELRAPVALGRIAEVEPWVIGNAAGYLFDAGAQPALANGWVAAGAVISTRIERIWGEPGDTLRHVIEPRVELRGGTGVAGPGLPAYAYDESDAAPVLPAAPCVNPPPGISGGCLPIRSLSATIPGGFGQMRLALRNRLVGSAGAQSATRLDLDLGQDFDLSSGKPSETWIRGSTAWGPLRGSLLARFLGFGAANAPGTWAPTYTSWLDAFTEVRLDLAAADRRGDRIHVGFLALGSGASAAMKAGLDPLFDPRPIPFQPFAQGTAGARIRVLGGLDLEYEALFSARSVLSPNYQTGTTQTTSPALQQQVFGAGWTSPCECWRAVVKVVVADGGFFNVVAALDLSEVRGFRLVP